MGEINFDLSSSLHDPSLTLVVCREHIYVRACRGEGGAGVRPRRDPKSTATISPFRTERYRGFYELPRGLLVRSRVRWRVSRKQYPKKMCSQIAFTL